MCVPSSLRHPSFIPSFNILSETDFPAASPFFFLFLLFLLDLHQEHLKFPMRNFQNDGMDFFTRSPTPTRERLEGGEHLRKCCRRNENRSGDFVDLDVENVNT